MSDNFKYTGEMTEASNYFNNMNSIPSVLIVWLDDNPNENCQRTILQLQQIVNRVEPFTDVDECVDFLTDVRKENVIMIISSTLSRTTIPVIYDVTQLHSIFVHVGDERKQEFWPKEWWKVKGVFADNSLLCDAIEQVVQQFEKNDISISFLPTSDNVSTENLNQLDPSFMYTQILKEILLNINFQEDHVKEFIDYCRRRFINENHRLNRIEDFEEKYRRNTPIRLYTKETFLYSMLNRALREIDVDCIMKIRFFLCALHRHINDLHENQSGIGHFTRPFLVYRGQHLSTKDFDRMKKTKDGLMSFNNFLSTSNDRDVALVFVETDLNDSDLVGILFVMTIDPSRSTTPFANIKEFTQFKDEDEILFCMHTIFRIGEIKQIDAKKRLWQVNLTLTNDNDRDLRILTDRIRVETHPEVDGWQRLALALMMMGEPQKAEQIYTVLIRNARSNRKKAILYHQLGQAKELQKDYGEAIVLYETSREYMEKVLRRNHPNLIACYNSIGNAYLNLDEYLKAISFYQKALNIQLEILPANHADLASSYNNIASAYYLEGDNSNALCFYENALEIQTKILPSNHPHLATTNSNIGLVYHRMRKYTDALAFHEIALEIRRKTLLPNHPDLATSYNNIASVYKSMGDRSKASFYYRKAHEIE